MSNSQISSNAVLEKFKIEYPPTTQIEANGWAKHTLTEKISGVIYERTRTWHVGKVDGDGNCYWRAVALHFYGDEKHWPWIKAQHLEWFYIVLKDPSHPRHARYAALDIAAWDSDRKTKSISQALMTAGAFTNRLMIQVTADLYDWNVFWIFPTNRNPASSQPEYNINSRGCANSTQRFLLFRDCHWDAVVPDWASKANRPSECIYTHLRREPQIEAYPPGRPLEDKRRTDSWKYGPDSGLEIPDRLLPAPIIYVFPMVTKTAMENVLGVPYEKVAIPLRYPRSEVPRRGTAIRTPGPQYGLAPEPAMVSAVQDIERRQKQAKNPRKKPRFNEDNDFHEILIVSDEDLA